MLHLRAKHDEVLLDWSRQCSGHLGEESCTFDAMAAKLTGAFRRRTRRTQTHALVKVQYDHVPQEWLNEFAAFCHCNQVAVVHLIRTSLLDTYWSMQAKVMDVAQQGELRDRVYDHAGVQELHSNRRTLHLPEAAAASFVRAIESRRQAYRLLLHLYPHPLLYTEVFYEDLTGPSGNAHFRALQHLLGMRLTRLSSAGLVRVHPGKCSAKIANWDVLRAYFLKQGLHQAVRACELPARQL